MFQLARDMKTFRVISRLAIIAAMILVIFSVVAEATSFSGSAVAEKAADATEVVGDDVEAVENPWGNWESDYAWFVDLASGGTWL